MLALLRSEKPRVFRLQGDRVYAALINDALASRDLMIAVASRQGRLVGFSIIAWNWSRLKLVFALRHPIVGLTIVLSMLRSRLLGRRVDEALGSAARERFRSDAQISSTRVPNWADGGRRIAKLIHTAVVPEHRRQGIGLGLKAFYVDVLRARGFRRVDARIDPANVASVAMQRSSGWVVVDDPRAVFAYLELGDDSERG